MRRALTTCCLLLALIVTAAHPGVASATSVQELTRIKGHGESVLQGLGLVVGLPGTGDSGEELAVAGPLLSVLRELGNNVLSAENLENTRSVALVMVTCVIPAQGAMIDDRLDLTVSVINSAQDLTGGQLYLTPLIGPHPGAPVYAMAEGPLLIERPDVPTRARVAQGARMVQDVLPAEIGSVFTLVVDEHKAGFGVTAEIASAINAEYFNSPTGAGDRVATPLNHREVRIDIPEFERSSPADFIAAVLATDINPELLRLPAKVFVNRTTGIININGDVQITPGVVTVRGLTVTTTLPALEPTPETPRVDRSRFIALGTGLDDQRGATLQDLIDAFNRLDVPVEQQIDIIRALKRSGQLHAELVID